MEVILAASETLRMRGVEATSVEREAALARILAHTDAAACLADVFRGDFIRAWMRRRKKKTAEEEDKEEEEEAHVRGCLSFVILCCYNTAENQNVLEERFGVRKGLIRIISVHEDEEEEEEEDEKDDDDAVGNKERVERVIAHSVRCLVNCVSGNVAAAADVWRRCFPQLFARWLRRRDGQHHGDVGCLLVVLVVSLGDGGGGTAGALKAVCGSSQVMAELVERSRRNDKVLQWLCKLLRMVYEDESGVARAAEMTAAVLSAVKERAAFSSTLQIIKCLFPANTKQCHRVVISLLFHLITLMERYHKSLLATATTTTSASTETTTTVWTVSDAFYISKMCDVIADIVKDSRDGDGDEEKKSGYAALCEEILKTTALEIMILLLEALWVAQGGRKARQVGLPDDDDDDADDNNNADSDNDDGGKKKRKRRSDSFEIKTNMMRVMSNVSFYHSEKMGGIFLHHHRRGVVVLLNALNLDDDNPFLKEWALLCIKNLCQRHEEVRNTIEMINTSGNNNNNNNNNMKDDVK